MSIVYHSLILLASSLRKINNKTVNAIKLDPPYEKNGRGTPMVGNSPISIVILKAKWMNRKQITQ